MSEAFCVEEIHGRVAACDRWRTACALHGRHDWIPRIDALAQRWGDQMARVQRLDGPEGRVAYWEAYAAQCSSWYAWAVEHEQREQASIADAARAKALDLAAKYGA